MRGEGGRLGKLAVPPSWVETGESRSVLPGHLSVTVPPRHCGGRTLPLLPKCAGPPACAIVWVPECLPACLRLEAVIAPCAKPLSGVPFGEKREWR